MQILFATVIDWALEKRGPLKIGSQAMIDALSDMTLRYLEFSGNRAWSANTADAEETDEQAPTLPAIRKRMRTTTRPKCRKATLRSSTLTYGP